MTGKRSGPLTQLQPSDKGKEKERMRNEHNAAAASTELGWESAASQLRLKALGPWPPAFWGKTKKGPKKGEKNGGDVTLKAR